MTDPSTVHRTTAGDSAALVPSPQRHRLEPEPQGPVGPDAPPRPTPAPSTTGTGTGTGTGTSTSSEVRPGRRGRRLRRAGVVVLVLALVGATVAAVHLYRTSQAWEARASQYQRDAEDLGGELAASRGELEGARAELDAVLAQLTTAQARIVALADEKAQVTDDREVQRQLVDYQERVSDAAGDVALALDQCVQGQNQLIGYMENASQYNPAELDAFGQDVQTLCQAATEANAALQRELAR